MSWGVIFEGLGVPDTLLAETMTGCETAWRIIVKVHDNEIPFLLISGTVKDILGIAHMFGDWLMET